MPIRPVVCPVANSGTRYALLTRSYYSLQPMTARIWIVIPTYNEASNIERIVRATVDELTRLAPDDHRILIVDDNSPDGTGAIADSLAEETARVEVLHRSAKSGLGHAYLAGFARAQAGGADFIVEMDADFSHDPGYLGSLLEAAREADVVLGSRYVPGGGVRGAYARAILRVEVRDLTGGFKCIRREVLEAIDLPSVRADGYVFQIEVTYRALLAGFRVKEVPIVFRDRASGVSKMSARIALEAMWLVPQLRRSAAVAVAKGARDTASSNAVVGSR
jgi:dolichol-phosphate mannosyltransferase